MKKPKVLAIFLLATLAIYGITTVIAHGSDEDTQNTADEYHPMDDHFNMMDDDHFDMMDIFSNMFSEHFSGIMDQDGCH